jgi:hypothetical protein
LVYGACRLPNRPFGPPAVPPILSPEALVD